ncbi:Izumo Sperm-Egg Fusion Protein 3 [Manis pentadactyla]|nr:Izumo Sperm-Egg Fusion Protein 3 [Manis pentadactyla]
MGDLRLLLLLPLFLAAFHEVTGCLECDPKFTVDVKSLLAKPVPSEVPGRTHLLERQIKEMIRLSFKVSHSDKMLLVLNVQNAVKLRTWLKNEFYKLGNETWEEEDSRKAEIREIALFLILLAVAIILGSALLLFHICVSHRRKMKAIQRSLRKYLEMKLEDLMGMTDEKEKDNFGSR